MFRICFLVITLITALVAPVHASEVSVSPVRVDLVDQKSIVPVTIYNAGDEVVVMETSVRAWNQNSTSGQWILSSTSAVQAFPGIIRIQPKASAVVRVGLAPSTNVSIRQGTYRLFLRELVDPRPSKSAAVRMVLNINLPVFVGGPSPGSSGDSAGELTAAEASDGVVNFAYKNPASSPTLVPQDATYSWLGEGDRELANTRGKINAYALPGGVGRWNERIPVNCKDVRRIVVQGALGVSLSTSLSCK